MKIEEQVLSREQMARLKELGVDTSDASMAWFMSPKTRQWKIKVKNNFSHELLLRLSPERYIPTYTIGDLIEKLPKGIEGNYLYIKYGWEYGYEHIYRRLYVYDDSHIERLYELFCWVAENHKELIKKDMKKQSRLALKISRFLPLYIDLGKLRRIVGPKDKGYTLAIWNCGDGTNLRTILRDLRITIRKDGLYWKTIKHGYV